MISFKKRHFSKSVILMAVRWYVAYALSYRDIEEMMAERGIEVDHSTLNRWVIKYAPQLEKAFHQKKKNRLPRLAVSVIAVSGIFSVVTV